jgi:hypothetical protein
VNICVGKTGFELFSLSSKGYRYDVNVIVGIKFPVIASLHYS